MVHTFILNKIFEKKIKKSYSISKSIENFWNIKERQQISLHITSFFFRTFFLHPGTPPDLWPSAFFGFRNSNWVRFPGFYYPLVSLSAPARSCAHFLFACVFVCFAACLLKCAHVSRQGLVNLIAKSNFIFGDEKKNTHNSLFMTRVCCFRECLVNLMSLCTLCDYVTVFDNSYTIE